MDLFNSDVKATALNNSVSDQVKSTMLITLWVFTGVEGASVLSAHAKKRSDVGLATVLGIIIALALYVAITILSLEFCHGKLLPIWQIRQWGRCSMQ
ncbi:Putative arginine/ornithine antiporter [Mannheimia haemolytica]|uniref:Arginine/ornithine antiporter n=1 Tax=Mannheimia haemolytica TaxID=75985 RepID=A0A378N7W4_MANHA|nr:Putative arginine/ornithine antiporter [Mannheimia haemolytica]